MFLMTLYKIPSWHFKNFFEALIKISAHRLKWIVRKRESSVRSIMSTSLETRKNLMTLMWWKKKLELLIDRWSSEKNLSQSTWPGQCGRVISSLRKISRITLVVDVECWKSEIYLFKLYKFMKIKFLKYVKVWILQKR